MFGCRTLYAIRGTHVNYTCIQGIWMPTRKVVEYGFDASIYLYQSYKMELPTCDKYCLSLTNFISNQSSLTPSYCSDKRLLTT